MYKTLKELLARDANGRLTLLNPLEPLNAEPTNRGTRAIASSVDKLLAARTVGQSFRVQSTSSSVAWNNDTSTLSVGSLVLQCASPVSGDTIEVSPYVITLNGNFSVPAYRVLILPEAPASITINNSDVRLLNFSSIEELVTEITALSGDQQARAVLIAAKHTTSVWVAPGIFIANGSTVTNFGTDSQYAIQEDFLELEDRVSERDHVSFSEDVESSLLLSRTAGVYTITNNDNYRLFAYFKSHRFLQINLPSPLALTGGEILYATYLSMEDSSVNSTTAVVGNWLDAGAAENYIVLLTVADDGDVVFSPIGNNHITIANGRSGVPFTLCGRVNPNQITYETAVRTLIRNNTFGAAIPVSPHTTSSFPRLVKSGGSAQSAYADTGVEAHKVVCGDLTVYGTPKSGETGGGFSYPPAGATYAVVKTSSASGTETPGIETNFVFVDGPAWADDIYLGSTPTGRVSAKLRLESFALEMSTANFNINDLEDRMDGAEFRLDNVEADVTALQTDMTTAQGDIEAVETLLPIVEFVAEFSRNLAHEARYFGSAMDIKYDGEMDFSYDNTQLNPSFRRPRPYLSVRVGTPIATLRAGAVRGLSSDGYRLFILDLYDNTNYRLRSVRLDVSSAPDWENTISNTTTVPVLNDAIPFLECSGHDVYLMSVSNKVATRYNRALVRQEFDVTSRTTLQITGNNTVICNRYYLTWYHNSSNNIAVLRLGNTSLSPPRIHNPESFTSSATTTTTVNLGSIGRILSVTSFGKICGLLVQTTAGASIVQARVDNNGSINIGSPLLAYDGDPTAFASSCTDGEFFFFATGLSTNLNNSIHLAITTISRENDIPDFEIVFGDELTHTKYPGLFNIQKILADGNTLYLVCRTAVYAFKYNGAPTRLSFCWSYPIDGGEAYCAALTWAGLIIGLKGFDSENATQNTVIWLRTDTYGKELIEFEETEPSEDWLYRKPFRQLRTFMS